MSLHDVTVKLRGDITDFASKLTTASTQMAKFAAQTAKSTTAGNKEFKLYNKTIESATSSLRTHNLGLKDTARIVQGIVISQMFYRATGAIRDAASALWEFNEALDYASVTYSALFGSKDLSDNFLQVLKDYAEETLFSFEDLTQSSKKLLAYGIPYKNLMFIMEGLNNLGAMSGDTEALDRIALALGQIYTKGKLSAEEMRQLANAYVPIYDIVKTKFGLSDDDMKSVGDLNLPAADVINAVVDYANENFGAVGDAAMLTITGLKNKISDSLKNLGVDIIAPLSTFFKSLLVFLSKKLSEIREAFNAGGVGGIFEYLVPNEDTQLRIRQFFANLSVLWAALKSLMHSIATFAKTFGASFMDALNVVMPIVNSFIRIFAVMAQYITSNTTALKILTGALAAAAVGWLFFKVQALGALVVTAVTKAIYGVAAALVALSKLLAASPLLAVVLLITAGLVGVAAASNKADNAISNLFGKLTGAQGTGADDILKVSDGMEQASSDASAFSERLDTVANSMDNVTDSVEDAGKAANSTRKSLLSFDEVFKLNDASSGGSDGALDGLLDDLSDLSDLGGGGLGLDDIGLDIPDFSEYAKNFMDELQQSLLGQLALAGLGALLAGKILSGITKSISAGKLTGASAALSKALAQMLLGAFIGFGLDAILSTFTDKLWKLLEEKLDLADGSAEQASLAATIGSVIGGAFGMIIGGPGGAFIGAGIGHFVGGLVGLMWDEIDYALSNSMVGLGAGIATAIAKGWGASFGSVLGLLDFSSFKGFFSSIAGIFKGAGLKSVAKNGLIGLAIGIFVDAIAAMLWKSLAEKFGKDEGDINQAQVGQTIGSIVGTIIGGILGGPAGAIIGSAIGTFAGGLVGLFWDDIKAYLVDTGNKLGEWFTETKSGFQSWWDETTAGLENWRTMDISDWATWANDTKHNFSTWWQETKDGFQEWKNDTGLNVLTWKQDLVQVFRDWRSATLEDIRYWINDSVAGFVDWSEDTLEKFNTWKSDTKAGFAEWVLDTSTGFSDWWSETKTGWSEWALETAVGLKDWRTKDKEDWQEWWDTTKEGLSDWATETKEGFSSWSTETRTKLDTWFAKSSEGFRTWWSETKTGFSDWWNSVWYDISTGKSGWDRISGWFTDLRNRISQWWTDLKDSISRWWDNLWSDKSATITTSNGYTSTASLRGYATGGIVNREQIARVAEGNRSEAIIPLQDAGAMQPFVDAVSNGLLASILPTLVTAGAGSAGSELPPVYVGTLIADDRGLKELERKMRVIRVQEERRGN